MTYKGRRL